MEQQQDFGPVHLVCGDSRELLRGLADNSVDSIVTDPPYELAFMGKGWDASGVAWDAGLWREALRVLKPGGHVIAFAGSRTYHRLAVAIEDAGFEIRDQLLWLYSQGMPKGQNVAKAMAKAGEVIHSEKWEGWNTTLKPTHEPMVLARKPLAARTVVDNLIVHGAGALNVDACRVPVDPEADAGQLRTMQRGQRAGGDGWGWSTGGGSTPAVVRPEGRWPANLVHDGSPEVVALFPAQAGAHAAVHKRGGSSKFKNTYGAFRGNEDEAGGTYHADAGSAARFFYCAKTTPADRHDGLAEGGNAHPTVKPTELMRWLCRLVTPPGGAVLDLFMGSGSTGRGARMEGFNFIGFELDAAHVEVSRQRIAAAELQLQAAEAARAAAPAQLPLIA